MNRLLPTTFFLFIFFMMSYGQHSLVPKSHHYLSPVPPSPHPAANIQDAPAPRPGSHDIPANNRDEEEVNIGTTFFDYQTAASSGRRIYTNGEEVSAIWHFGINSTGFPDRGTGYNHFDGVEWGPQPTERVEGAIRGGYPCFTVLEDGTEVVISHTLVGAVWHLNIYRKSPGSDIWAQSEIPSAVSTGGMVWAKVATGGADGNTLHAIAITLHPDFGGTPYEGLDQHLLYYRSQDGGDTWDISDMIIPDCDSTFYNTIDSEAYGIDANGETVSIGVFPSWGDAAIFKSADNGDSWVKNTILDFPLDKYDGNGYTIDDIPMDPDAPDSLAILSTDGYCSIVVDDDGLTHVVYGNMYYLGIGGFFYYPGTDGLVYWNESLGTGNGQNVAFTEDFDGSGTIEVAGIAGYFLSLTSMPSMGIDVAGNYYIAYTAFNELYINDEDNQNYNQVYIIASTDGGVTWTDPYAAINEETTDIDLVPFIEGVYPNIPKQIGSSIQLMYQQDFRPGLHVAGDQDASELNYIVYSEIDEENLGITSINEPDLTLESFQILPNPTNGLITIEYALNESAHVNISVFDMLGKDVIQLPKGARPVGNYSENIELGNLSKSVYLVRIQAGERVWTEKVILE